MIVIPERMQGYADPHVICDAVLLKMDAQKGKKERISSRVSIFKDVLGLKVQPYGPEAKAGGYYTTTRWMSTRVWGVHVLEKTNLIFVA